MREIGTEHRHFAVLAFASVALFARAGTLAGL